MEENLSRQDLGEMRICGHQGNNRKKEEAGNTDKVNRSVNGQKEKTDQPMELKTNYRLV